MEAKAGTKSIGKGSVAIYSMDYVRPVGPSVELTGPYDRLLPSTVITKRAPESSAPNSITIDSGKWIGVAGYYQNYALIMRLSIPPTPGCGFVEKDKIFVSKPAERGKNAELKSTALGYLKGYSTSSGSDIVNLFNQAKTLLNLDSDWKIVFDTDVNLKGSRGTCDYFAPKTVTINLKYVGDMSILNTVLHEARHAYQLETWFTPIRHYYVSYETFEYWNPYSPLNNQGKTGSNTTSKEQELYWARPIEWDTREFADQRHLDSVVHYSANWR